MINCPLCGDPTRSRGPKIKSSDVINLWKKLDVNVSDLITEDIQEYKCKNCSLGFFWPLFPGDDKFYGRLASWDWYYKHPGKSEYSYTAKLLSPGDRVLDVGCGIGEFSTYMPNRVHFHGVELSTRSVEMAVALERNVERIDINSAPSDMLSKYDCVTCFQVLEHLPEIKNFFSSLMRFCKPGGKIVLAVPNNDGFLNSAPNNLLNMPPHHILLWNKASLLYLAKINDLEVVEYLEEELQAVHQNWAFAVMINKFLTRCIFTTPQRLDQSIVKRFLWKISNIMARIVSPLAPQRDWVGHSSIIVLRKT